MEKIILDSLDLRDAVHQQALYDARILTHHLGTKNSLTALARVHGFATRFHGEMSEMFLSSGCSASLCAYRRPGQFWRYLPASRVSIRGGQLVEALDDLRESISLTQSTIGQLVRMRGKEDLVRAVALCGLALDAIDDEHFDIYADLAGIPTDVTDIAGYALNACEEHFSEDKKTPRRRLTANPDKGRYTPRPPRKRLTANPAHIRSPPS